MAERHSTYESFVRNDPRNPLLILSEYLADNGLASLEKKPEGDVRVKLSPAGTRVFRQVFPMPAFRALMSVYDPLFYPAPNHYCESSFDDRTIQKILTAYWANKAGIYDKTATSESVVRRRNEAQAMYENFRQRAEPLMLEETRLLIGQLIESIASQREV